MCTLLRNGFVQLRRSATALRWCSSNGARFSEQHEWARRDSDASIRVGVSKFAEEALGEVVFAQLPEVGQRVAQGDPCGALESVKAASELYSPLAGTVTESNAAVVAQPSLINKDCYGDGWLFKLKPDDPASLDRLMSEERYLKFVTEETH